MISFQRVPSSIFLIESLHRYLAISDIDTVGFRHKYTQDWTHGHLGVLTELPEAKQGPPKKISELKGRKYHYTKDDGYAVYKDPSVDDDPLGFVSADCGSDPEDNASPEPPSEHVDKKRKTGSTPLGEMDPNQASTLTGNPKPPKAQPGPPKAKGICKISAPATLSEDTTFYNQLVLAHAKRCHERPVVHGRWCGCKICHPKNHLWGEPEASESNSVAATAEPSAPPPPPKGKKQAKSLHAATPSTSQAALVAFAVAEHLKPIRRPLELHTLASLRPSRYWRNKLGDYFGVVSWVDNKTVTRMMGRLKRDLRIVDPTLDRQVLLSVFVDPVHFTPAVGTVALFRNLRTHEWEGGSLNAYPKDCDGYDWFVPHPVHIEACDVAGMREWFDGWLEEHGEERRFDALEEMVKGQDTREIAPQCHKECMKPAPDAELVTGE